MFSQPDLFHGLFSPVVPEHPAFFGFNVDRGGLVAGVMIPPCWRRVSIAFDRLPRNWNAFINLALRYARITL